MYSAGFYPYPDEESFWGYWSKQAILGGIDLDVTPLYKDILNLVKDKKMNQARKNCKIPTYIVPKCPVCGGPMTMNLRCDQYFVQDGAWYKAEKRFGDFLTKALNSKKNLLLLELGVGFNTPTIIRFPFEKLVKENKQINMLRLNLNEAIIPQSIENRTIGINKDIKQTIQDLLEISSEI